MSLPAQCRLASLQRRKRTIGQTRGDNPSVVYRSLDLPTVERLAEYLRESGIDARVSVPDPHGAQTVPMFQTHHEVLAINFETKAVRKLIEKWQSAAGGKSLLRSSQTELYCYHCGESLASQLPTCPACNAALEELRLWNG